MCVSISRWHIVHATAWIFRFLERLCAQTRAKRGDMNENAELTEEMEKEAQRSNGLNSCFSSSTTFVSHSPHLTTVIVVAVRIRFDASTFPFFYYVTMTSLWAYRIPS